jgi:hypothetical protein
MNKLDRKRKNIWSSYILVHEFTYDRFCSCDRWSLFSDHDITNMSMFFDDQFCSLCVTSNDLKIYVASDNIEPKTNLRIPEKLCMCVPDAGRVAAVESSRCLFRVYKSQNYFTKTFLMINFINHNIFRNRGAKCSQTKFAYKVGFATEALLAFRNSLQKPS